VFSFLASTNTNAVTYVVQSTTDLRTVPWADNSGVTASITNFPISSLRRRIMPTKEAPLIAATGRRLPKGNRGGVELLLVHAVEHLGKQGEVVEVKRGYAYNYLLPQGLATIATDHHKRMVEKHRAKLEEIARERLAGLRTVLQELVRTSVTIEANANDEGHLYGSVGAPEISRSLKQQDLMVSPEQIILQGPLKEVGLYTVKVKLAPEVEGDLKVWVVPSSSEGGAK
jgi:large subunit ribosomal protein L9